MQNDSCFKIMFTVVNCYIMSLAVAVSCYIMLTVVCC